MSPNIIKAITVDDSVVDSLKKQKTINLAIVQEHLMEQNTLKNIYSCWNTKITFFLDICGSKILTYI